MRKLLFLNSAQRFSDFTLLLLRVFVGIYLVWGVWRVITDPVHMQAAVHSFEIHGLPASSIVAPVLAWLLIAIGAGFILGLFTRWAGILCALISALAIVTIHRGEGMGGLALPGCLLVISLFLGTHGAGRFSVDAALGANDLPRSNGGVRFKS